MILYHFHTFAFFYVGLPCQLPSYTADTDFLNDLFVKLCRRICGCSLVDVSVANDRIVVLYSSRPFRFSPFYFFTSAF